MPNAAAAAAVDMELPGLLVMNNKFYIKIDEKAIHLPSTVTLLQEAVAYLVMFYYILDLNYPEPLKFVFGFFERLFQIENSGSVSYDLKKLCAFVCDDM